MTIYLNDYYSVTIFHAKRVGPGRFISTGGIFRRDTQQEVENVVGEDAVMTAADKIAIKSARIKIAGRGSRLTGKNNSGLRTFGLFGVHHRRCEGGVRAARAGHKVYCTSVKRLGQAILKAKARGTLDRLFTKMLSAQLWIFDDWGVVSMTREIAEEVFDLLDRRKQSTAMILTSNRDVCEWGQVFPEPVLASAAIDRLFDRAEIILFNGKSYRLGRRITTLELDEGKGDRH